MIEQNIVDEFHKLYYDNRNRTWSNTYWMGVPLEKVPLDLWIYQEIIYETIPDIIIETGTGRGGSALFLANMFDVAQIMARYSGKGRVLTIDIEIRDNKPGPIHGRIWYLMGNSVSNDVVENVKKHIGHEDKVMVILDSAHDKEHVIKEMLIYGKFVSVGCYLIVEDSNVGVILYGPILARAQ